MFYYDDIFFDNRTLQYLLDTVGSSQVMIGSDYPFMWRDQTPVEEFDALNLTPAEREAIGSGNCLRFLRLA
jgi:aminocarboxymuconate-semialdehyde decarboxylase